MLKNYTNTNLKDLTTIILKEILNVHITNSIFQRNRKGSVLSNNIRYRRFIGFLEYLLEFISGDKMIDSYSLFLIEDHYT